MSTSRAAPAADRVDASVCQSPGFQNSKFSCESHFSTDRDPKSALLCRSRVFVIDRSAQYLDLLTTSLFTFSYKQKYVL
eukprot:scaffold348074_cov30-Prasinocladus_malaysianus.AAC.3